MKVKGCVVYPVYVEIDVDMNNKELTLEDVHQLLLQAGEKAFETSTVKPVLHSWEHVDENVDGRSSYSLS